MIVLKLERGISGADLREKGSDKRTWNERHHLGGKMGRPRIVQTPAEKLERLRAKWRRASAKKLLKKKELILAALASGS